jgi:hypothetical protein
VALAVFVLGVAFWRTPVTGYLASTTIVYETADAQIASIDGLGLRWPQTKEEIARQAVAPKIVRQAVMAFAGPTGQDDEAEPAEVDEQQLADIGDRLSAVATPDEDEGSCRIVVSYLGRTPDGAVPLVNKVAESFVGHCDSLDQSLRQSLKAKLEMATTRVDEARQKLESTDEQREMARQRVADAQKEMGTAKSTAEDPSATTAADSTPGLSEEAPLNPDWVRVRDHVTGLNDQKATLGATLTEAHPEMKEVMAEIAVFAAILDRTPKYLRDQDPEDRPDHATETGPYPHDLAFPGGFNQPHLNPAQNVDREGHNTATRDTAVAKRLEEASRHAEQFDQAHELARADLSRAQQREREVRESLRVAWFTRARVDTWAESADRIGGIFPLSRVFVMLGAALAAGAVVFAFAPRKVADRVLRRVVDVEERVGLAVVGAISTGLKTNATPSRSSSRRGVLRLLVVSAEFVLIAVVVVFLVATLLDRQLAAAYLDDPFGTFGETLKAATQRLLPR